MGNSLIIIMIYYGIFCGFNSQIIKDENVIKLTQNLAAYFNDIIKFINVPELAQTLSLKSKLVDDTEAIRLLRESKNASEAIVTRSSQVVDNLQKKVSGLYKSFSNTTQITYALECKNSSYVYYYRAKALNDSNENNKEACDTQLLKMNVDPYVDNVRTSREYSTAHIPTNVYYAAKEIQRIASLTENLDSEFRREINNPKVRWQYFCSNTGFFRIYPGVRWHIQVADSLKENTLVDFFDCRSEQWYLESTAYPKKMMIIVDRSGSMKGRRKIIANHTINEILDTLTENDFFNIILFTKVYIYADNKTNDILVQATAKNKKFMMEELEKNFNPEGIAEYDVGLNVSLELLKKSKDKENPPDRYNYLLMIISDGSPFNYQGIIEHQKTKLNLNDLRIFTYLIGQGITEGEPVKEMACNNRGYAVEIATLADVKENVQKYLNVVARYNAIANNLFSVWTGIHQNQILAKKPESTSNAAPASVVVVPVLPNFVQMTNNLNSSSLSYATSSNVTTVEPEKKIVIEKPEDIKMFVSTAKATYNTTFEPSLLGAVGIDVPIADFISTAPTWKIGINAYLFGVTNNGFVLFHPRFRPQYKSFIKYFYRNVDISEVEIPTNANISYIPDDQVLDSPLRKDFIEKKFTNPAFSTELETYTIVDEFLTAFPITRRYFITDIAQTSYKFSLAVPNNHFVPYYDVTDVNCNIITSNQANLLPNEDNPLLSTSNTGGITLAFYEFCKTDKERASILLNSPLKLIKKSFLNCNYCSDNFVKYIYKELDDTKAYNTIWQNKKPIESVQQIFSMHHYGVIRYHNYVNLSYENFISDHKKGIDDPLYQETVLTSQAIKSQSTLVIRPLPNEEIKKEVPLKNIVFTATLPLYKSGIYGGIAGVQVPYTTLQSVFNSNSVCNNTKNYQCYLLTSSGLIVYSNVDYKHIGDHLKEIDCRLMKSLTESNIFQNQTLYDFQGLCPDQPKLTDNFANRLMDPFMMLWKFSMWIIYEMILLIQNISLSNFYWSFTEQEENPKYTVITPYKWRLCYLTFKMTSSLTSPSKSIDLERTIPCCNRTWYAKDILSTSTILVIVKKLDCNCDCEGNFGQSQELKRNTSRSLVNPTLLRPSYYSDFANVNNTETTKVCKACEDRMFVLRWWALIIVILVVNIISI